MSIPSIQSRLQALGLSLPPAPRPLGNFAPYLIDAGYLYISGQISVDDEGRVMTGQLGADLNLPQGQAAARACASRIGAGMLRRAITIPPARCRRPRTIP